MKRILVLTIAIMMLWTTGALSAETVEIKVKSVPPQAVLQLNGVSSVETIGEDMGRMYGKLFEFLGQKRIHPTGSPIALYFSESGPQWAVAVALPVPEGTEGEGDIKAVVLKGGDMASLIHVGSYEKLGEAWTRLARWIQQNGYKTAGPSREIYFVGPPEETDPSKFHTELLWPVSK